MEMFDGGWPQCGITINCVDIDAGVHIDVVLKHDY